jgi:hypothetical protein
MSSGHVTPVVETIVVFIAGFLSYMTSLLGDFSGIIAILCKKYY